MQDLDFDELDKAVNSLMPKTKSATVDEPAQAVPTVPVNEPADPIITSPSLAPKPALNVVERPSTGRFMDVVHPSSNMRANINLPQRPMPVAPVSKPDYSQPSVPLTPANQNNKAQNSPVVQPPVVNNWAGLSNYQEPSEIPESPFLPEAKVEKRPLGAFSDEVGPVAPVSEQNSEQPAISNSETIDKPKSDEAIDLSKTLPAELDGSVMNVESSGSTHSNAAEIAINPLSQLSKTSINQQYTEKPSPAIKESTSIYDTSSYNKAVVRKPKKKSGWLMVLWIVLLLIAGVGAGVGFYFYIAPNLLNLKLPF